MDTYVNPTITWGVRHGDIIVVSYVQDDDGTEGLGFGHYLRSPEGKDQVLWFAQRRDLAAYGIDVEKCSFPIGVSDLIVLGTLPHPRATQLAVGHIDDLSDNTSWKKIADYGALRFKKWHLRGFVFNYGHTSQEVMPYSDPRKDEQIRVAVHSALNYLPPFSDALIEGKAELVAIKKKAGMCSVCNRYRNEIGHCVLVREECTAFPLGPDCKDRYVFAAEAVLRIKQAA